MTEEKGGSRNRKGRRRYFQTKKDNKPQGGQAQPGGQGGGGGQRAQDGRQDSRGPSAKARKARRRARSRQRYDDNRAVNLEAEVAYVAPQAVYIYEHSVHPELRDAYEFRPDHFSSVGRTLADYDIDLSKLFPGDIAGDGTPVMNNMLPKPQYDWSGWEEEVKEVQPVEVQAVEVQAAIEVQEVQEETEKG
jgi:hypothetical protein